MVTKVLESYPLGGVAVEIPGSTTLRIRYALTSLAGGFAWHWRFQGDKTEGTASSASAAFLAAGARAGWPPPEDWPHPGEQYDGELAELDLFLDAFSYRERELWVEKTETGWRARVKERGDVLWTAEDFTPGLAVLEVGRKALNQHSTARFI